MSELPSCVYATHQVANSSTNSNSLRLNSSNIRQLQYIHQTDCLESPNHHPSGLSASALGNNPHYAPYKIQRQQQNNVRERKRMARSAPNG